MKQLRVLLFVLAALASRASAHVYFVQQPSASKAAKSQNSVSLANRVLRAAWSFDSKSFRATEFVDRQTQRTLPLPPDLFILILADGRAVRASEMKLAEPPATESLKADANASRVSERLNGESVVADLEDAQTGLKVRWRAVLRDGSNYIRQEITLTATKSEVAIAEVRMIDWNLPDARVVGTVKGSPIVAGQIFTGFEHPLSQCAVGAGRARCVLERKLPLQPGAPVTYSNVIGVAPSGQLRRAFLYYLERERAHPYRPFLHYNSWYDLRNYGETSALDRVHAIGDELNKKRHVQIASYLWDDGWDDHASLWKFRPDFPDGFAAVRRAAEQYGAEPGVWMSPWGGYGAAREQRVAAGRAAGYEIVDNGFALSGPKYYRVFRDTAVEMIHKYGANQFKFDGTGNANRVVPGSEFDSDFDAAIHLIGELRREQPSLFVNLTTGTFPSPFWLRYADSTWRGGHDHSFAGVGSSRQRWITYRDAATYQNVVLGGPLYPLNALMLHGIIYARFAKGLDSDPEHEFRNEVRSFFGTGTQLQELYITPSLLTAADWDDLAEAANWSRAHTDALVDTHWIGGDPEQLEVYGWAAWSPKQATLVLRNPSDKPQSIAIDIARAFELPDGASRVYKLKIPWKSDAAKAAVTVRAAEAHTFSLQPFEVAVFDATPQ